MGTHIKKNGYVLHLLIELRYYFQSVLNDEPAFFENLRFNLIVSHTWVLWAIPFLVLSFRHFHVLDKTTQKEFQIHIEPIAKQTIRICLLFSLVVIGINLFTQFYALGSIVMQIVVCYMFFLIIKSEYVYRNNLTIPITEANTILFRGGVIHLLIFFTGYILSVIDYYCGWSLGLEATLTFAVLLGFIVHNFIAFIAFNKRDHEILKERNLLHSQSIENELKVIQNSLNPHFIFNSLGLIDTMILKDKKEKARDVLFKFSDLLRTVMDKSSNKLISLKEEIKMVELYLQIEQQKSVHEFEFQIIIQDNMDIRFYRVPPLIIQPLVENAIRHGIFNREEKKDGLIIIRIGHTNTDITFEIEDNGIGYLQTKSTKPSDYYSRKHIGLNFTKRRIALLSGTEYTGNEIEIIDKSASDNESGTIVKFNIPINQN